MVAHFPSILFLIFRVFPTLFATFSRQNRYNFNKHDVLSPTLILDAHNIRGPAEETLPLLVQEVAELQRNSNIRRTSTRLRQREICA